MQKPAICQNTGVPQVGTHTNPPAAAAYSAATSVRLVGLARLARGGEGGPHTRPAIRAGLFKGPHNCWGALPTEVLAGRPPPWPYLSPQVPQSVESASVQKLVDKRVFVPYGIV